MCHWRKKEQYMHCLCVHSFHVEEILLQQILYTSFSLLSAWCLVHPWRRACAACMWSCVFGVCWTNGAEVWQGQEVKGLSFERQFCLPGDEENTLSWSPMKHAWHCMITMNPLEMPHQMTSWESILHLEWNSWRKIKEKSTINVLFQSYKAFGLSTLKTSVCYLSVCWLYNRNSVIKSTYTVYYMRI